MIRLYCFPRSGNSREVKLVLSEKGIAYEKVNIRDQSFDKESPEFKKASPRGMVPAIVDGDVHMSEAYSINEYLEGKYPRPALLPADGPERGQIRGWVMTYDKRLALKIGLLLIECLLKPKEQQKEETKVKLWEEAVAGMKEADRFLKGKEFFFGAYSLADISMTPHLAALHRVGKEIPADCPDLKAWMERVKSRPSFAATLD